VKRVVYVAACLTWWLIYYNGIFRQAFGTQALCERAASSLREQGIAARCAEIKSC
jgi:hypothetical protein